MGFRLTGTGAALLGFFVDGCQGSVTTRALLRAVYKVTIMMNKKVQDTGNINPPI
jgi:hypothetical protein